LKPLFFQNNKTETETGKANFEEQKPKTKPNFETVLVPGLNQQLHLKTSLHFYDLIDRLQASQPKHRIITCLSCDLF
jgi:hypothetical protein